MGMERCLRVANMLARASAINLIYLTRRSVTNLVSKYKVFDEKNIMPKFFVYLSCLYACYKTTGLHIDMYSHHWRLAQPS